MLVKAHNKRPINKALACALLVGTAIAAIESSVPANAQQVSGEAVSVQQTNFNIPGQSLASALTLFGQQSGLQVSVDSAVARGLSSPGVSGAFSDEEALARLLGGTNISYYFSDADTVIIAAESTATVLDDGSLVLDTIVVTAPDASRGSGFQGTPDWVYETSESVSVISREAIQNSGVRDTRDLMAGASGVYSGEGNGSFPTVSPNIRGLQDSGRVVVSIDGARQNAQRGYGFGSGGYQSNAGQAFVDSAFVRSVEIDKDPDASAGNAGSLGGSVNFRTIGADDLITGDKNWGVEANVTRGTNEYNFQGSVLGAVRLADTPFSVTLGISKLEMGEYAIGQNGDESNALKHFKGRDAFSSLFKLEGDFDDVQTTLSWMHQFNDFSYGSSGNFGNQETVHVDSLTGDLSWNPDDDLIDLNAKLWLNNSLTNELREARLNGSSPDTYIDLNTLSFGGILENTSVFDTQTGFVEVNYGVEAFRDTVTASATSETIELNPLWANRYTAFSPPGNRDVASAFVNADWEVQDWLTLSGGLRYDWYRLHGTPTYYHNEPANFYFATCQLTQYQHALNNGETVPPFLIPVMQGVCGEEYNGDFYRQGLRIQGLGTDAYYQPHELDIDRSDGAWLPALKAEFAPVDWLKPYISYSQSFRPPTVLEAFFTGGLPGDGAAGTNFAPNLSLRPESAQTFEVGANVSLDGIFMDDDRLRFKVAVFQREVDDYIVLGTILAGGVADKTYLSFVNLDGTTTMRGLEIEGNYDAGLFWLGGSATWLETSWPQSTDIFSNGTLTTDGKIFATAGNVPPRFKLTIDGGVRLMEKKLQLGVRLNHVTPTLSRFLDDEGNLSENTEAYTTIDVYGSYQVSDNATLRMAITNVTDLNYIPGSGTYNAPGRTATASFNVKF